MTKYMSKWQKMCRNASLEIEKNVTALFRAVTFFSISKFYSKILCKYLKKNNIEHRQLWLTQIKQPQYT